MLIIPSIDVVDGRCVRLMKGDFGQVTMYDPSPEAIAASYGGSGAEWIHLVDLDGAKSGFPKNWESLRSVAGVPGVKVQFGGGIRSIETAQKAFDLGASRVVIGTAMIEDEPAASALIDLIGDRLVVGIDARGGKAATRGWTETASKGVIELALQAEAMGAARIVLTDIGRDGTLGGPNLAFLQEALSEITVPIIHSGGVGTLKDISDLALLQDMGLEATIVGKALFECRFTLAEAIGALGTRA